MALLEEWVCVVLTNGRANSVGWDRGSKSCRAILMLGNKWTLLFLDLTGNYDDGNERRRWKRAPAVVNQAQFGKAIIGFIFNSVTKRKINIFAKIYNCILRFVTSSWCFSTADNLLKCVPAASCSSIHVLWVNIHQQLKKIKCFLSTKPDNNQNRTKLGHSSSSVEITLLEWTSSLSHFTSKSLSLSKQLQLSTLAEIMDSVQVLNQCSALLFHTQQRKNTLARINLWTCIWGDDAVAPLFVPTCFQKRWCKKQNDERTLKILKWTFSLTNFMAKLPSVRSDIPARKTDGGQSCECLFLQRGRREITSNSVTVLCITVGTDCFISCCFRSQQLTFNLNFYSRLRIREGLNIYRCTGDD